jgi:hypothetical protein
MRLASGRRGEGTAVASVRGLSRHQLLLIVLAEQARVFEEQAARIEAPTG